MATSGSVNFNLTVLQIITEAYALIRVGIEEEALTNAQAQEGRAALNMMLKAWNADGLRLWCKSEGVLFLTAAQEKYDVSSSSSDHHALSSDVVQTTISADEASGQTVISLTSIAGIASGDRIGVELDDGTMHWTTVNGAPAAGTATLTAALTGDASEGAVVFAYTTKLGRPTRVLGARRRDEDGMEVPCSVLERPDYMDTAHKASSSKVNQVYYDPQRDAGYLYVWPTSDNVTDTVRFTFERPLEDTDTLTETVDLPQEWLEPLAFNLAYRLSFRHSFPLAERQLLKTEAEQMKAKLLSFDREYGSVFFAPATQ